MQSGANSVDIGSGENGVEKKAFLDEGASKYRKLGPYSRPIVFALTLGITGLAVIFLFNIVIFGKVMLDNAYYLLMLASFLALLFLNIPATPRFTDKIPWYDIVLAVLGFSLPFYLSINAYEIIIEAWEALPPPFAVVIGTVLVLVVFEGVRRTSGLTLMLMVVAFTVYPLFASHAPGILKGVSYPFKKIIAYSTMGPESLTNSFGMEPVVRSVRAVVFIESNPVDVSPFPFYNSFIFIFKVSKNKRYNSFIFYRDLK